jgi:hypothetical protein
MSASRRERAGGGDEEDLAGALGLIVARALAVGTGPPALLRWLRANAGGLSLNPSTLAAGDERIEALVTRLVVTLGRGAAATRADHPGETLG